MAGKKPYQMAPAAPVKKAKPTAPAPKTSFANRIGDAIQDVGDYAKRGLADAEDAYAGVRNKIKGGDYGMAPDPANSKAWPYGRGLQAYWADEVHRENLVARKKRDAPPPPTQAPAPAKPAPPKRAPVARAAPKPSHAKPAPKTIDPYTADQEYTLNDHRFTMNDKGIKARPSPGQPGSKKLAPSQAVRGGDIVTDRARVNDPGINRKLPYQGDKTESLEVTVGGKKKTVRVPKAGKVKL